jgi:Na+-translocating ferredoxin:NAD+ oxidoreductase subunit B
MLTGLVVMLAIAVAIGLTLLHAAQRLPQNPESPVTRVNALLPQTQCGQCGYPGCRPYAEAIVEGSADINQCAPGGDALVTALARLLGRRSARLDPNYGSHEMPALAWIDEEACIGCTLCIAACPVDAIVGAAQFSHTVLRDACTGCKLCVTPCPVDCITIVPLHEADAA